MQCVVVYVGFKIDVDEVFFVGQVVVKVVIKGEIDVMVMLFCGDVDYYFVEIGLVFLSEIVNGVKKFFCEWINEDGISMNYQFVCYVQLLIQGEMLVLYDNGLFVFVKFEKECVEKFFGVYQF